MQQAIAPSTRAAYDTALKNYVQWRKAQHLSADIRGSTPREVCEWLTQLAVTQGRNSNTIALYRHALKTCISEHHSVTASSDHVSPCDHFTVLRVLKGIQRRASVPESLHRLANSATPITADMVRRIHAAGLINTLADQRSFAALTLGVSGFMRPGEFLGSRVLTWGQLTFYAKDGTQAVSPSHTPDHLTLMLPITKTDQMGRGRTIHIATPIAVSAAWEWYHHRPTDSTSHSPLFLNAAGLTLSLGRLLGTVRDWLTRVGYTQLNVQGRSFRRGGASGMAAAGESAATIQRAGRWRSDAATLYIGKKEEERRAIEASRRL